MTREADRTQMIWEEGRSLLLRGISFLENNMNELKQYRSPPTPVFPVSAVRTDTVAVQAPKDPQGYDELVLELRRCQDENLTLVRKNDTLKYNFFFLEDKYKKLRAELKDVRPRAQAPRSDRKRPAFALKEEGKAEEGVEGVAELGDSAAAEAAGGADVSLTRFLTGEVWATLRHSDFYAKDYQLFQVGQGGGGAELESACLPAALAACLSSCLPL